MSNVNQQVREQVKAIMKDRGVTQQAAADQLGISRIYVNQMLNGTTSQMPGRWVELLDLLGLELVVRQKS